jgi:hypothetical protein
MISVTRSIAILVLLGIMAQINCVAVYCGLFSMNRKAIAAAVCEKKTMDCCGHCFLKKKIASTQENQPASSEKTPPNKSAEDLLSMFLALEPDGQMPFIKAVNATPFYFFCANDPDEGHLRSIYHPPDAVLNTVCG